MSTFSIASFADWYNAITDSHLVPPATTTYTLTSALTFTSSNPPYLNTGTADTDYLYIRAGQTFNGQGNLLFLTKGCQPTNGIAGIFRAVGASGNTANFVNINIQGDTGLPWHTNSLGSLFISDFSPNYNANYVNVQYGIIQAATDTTVLGTSWVINSSNVVGNVTMDTVYMYLNGNVLNNGSTFLVVGGKFKAQGPCSFTNCVFECQSVIGPSSGNYASAVLGIYRNVPTTITNCYFYLSAEPTTTNANTSVISVSSNITLTNIYIILSTYSSSYSSDLTMIDTSGYPCILNDVYTNNTSFNIRNIADVSGSATTSYPFSANPFPSLPEWTYTSGPPLLTSLLTAPFSSSTYTTFDSLPAFSSGPVPCLCRGMKILTPSGDIPVESLNEGDLILVPPFHHRAVEIQKVFSSTFLGTQDNVPYRIPAHFFEENIPSEDIVLSPHHAVFYNGKWNLPIWISGLHREDHLIGKTFEYYHFGVPEYYSDKLWCHNLPVDSWEDSDPFMDPLEQEARANPSFVSITQYHTPTSQETTRFPILY